MKKKKFQENVYNTIVKKYMKMNVQKEIELVKEKKKDKHLS